MIQSVITVAGKVLVHYSSLISVSLYGSFKRRTSSEMLSLNESQRKSAHDNMRKKKQQQGTLIIAAVLSYSTWAYTLKQTGIFRIYPCQRMDSTRACCTISETQNLCLKDILHPKWAELMSPLRSCFPLINVFIQMELIEVLLKPVICAPWWDVTIISNYWCSLPPRLLWNMEMRVWDCPLISHQQGGFMHSVTLRQLRLFSVSTD